ncbi:MAG: hypothetical protein ACI9G5_002334 [Paracoccaceae bacterium]|jgi:hypothetical protein
MWVNNNTFTPVDRSQIITGKAMQRVLPSLSVGAVLNVLVASQGKAGAYELLANGERLYALSQQKLDIGGTYRLQVSGFDKSGQLVMRVLSDAPSAIQSALQQRLASQIEPGRLLQAVFTLIQTGSQLAQHPEFANVVAAFSQRRDISSGARLNERVQSSGLFFEHLLHLSGDKPPADLKGALLVLREWLAVRLRQTSPNKSVAVSLPSDDGDASVYRSFVAPSPAKHPIPLPLASSAYTNAQSTDKRPFSFVPQATAVAEVLDLTTLQGLKHAVEGAISRIEAQQLLSLQAQHQQQTFLLFEIPVVVRDQLSTWHFNIREEPSKNENSDDDSKSWTVVLSVELPVVGPLSIHLTHSEQATKITFYSERIPVCGLIDAAIPDFVERLERLGLAGVSLSSQLGKLPANQEPNIDYPSVHATA